MRTLIILSIIGPFIFSSCGNVGQTSDQNQTTEQTKKVEMTYYYKAYSNSMADIYIKVYKNNTFELYFKSLDEEEEWYFEGTAYETNNSIILKFGTEKPELNALFDEQFDENNAFEVINSNEVSIDKTASVVYIWGVSCKKM